MKINRPLSSLCPKQKNCVKKQQTPDTIKLEVSASKNLVTLNSSAIAVWNLCDRDRSIDAIIDDLAGRYGMAASNVRVDVEECILSLVNAGALTMHDSPVKTGHHPDTNVDEGHLGGYIRGRQSSVPTVYDFENGDPATWDPDLWSWAYETLGVRSMLDVGCGEGHAARYFRDLGCRVLGVDGSLQAKRDSVISDQHVIHDFTQAAYLPDDIFDLVWSCEFVEHVEECYLDNFLETFAYSQHFLMMTFASPGQPGFHHVNCQPMDYWIEKMEPIGFFFDEELTETTRAIASQGHYHERGLFFMRP